MLCLTLLPLRVFTTAVRNATEEVCDGGELIGNAFIVVDFSRVVRCRRGRGECGGGGRPSVSAVSRGGYVLVVRGSDISERELVVRVILGRRLHAVHRL